MKIFIKTLKGKSINLEVEDNYNTIDLKIHGEPTRQLVLDMDPGSDKDPFMTIFVSTLTGKTIVLAVKESVTIRKVKAVYAEKDGTPVDQLRMIFQGNLLEDSRTLAYYNIKNKSTLILMALQCGC